VSAAAKPLPPTWLDALRAIERDDFNPLGRAGSGVEVSVGRALLRRGLCERKGARMPLTAAGCAVLDAADGPSWGVEMLNHLHTPSDPDDEPAFFRREFRARTREEAHAAAVAFGEAAGDCSPSGGVEDVEGPLWAAGGEGVAK
jgi:hypothetical protein